MKSGRAYGGRYWLWRLTPGRGWGWEYSAYHTFPKPRAIKLAGKQFYMYGGGGHGFGDARTLRDARGHCVNALKQMPA